MATLVLGAVGTALGGPLGGALGSLAGRAIDGKVFNSDGAEGPRLSDLKVTTSSYGQPIPRHFGQVRVPGTIIWASDLVESKETSGGKGRPKTTSYSYSVSFAVALASNPIERIGRIWADGELLRNSAGELTSAGTLRIHHGHADQAADPLLASATNGIGPAYRGLAYAVFEDLQLELFGNRIPALTFEVFGGSQMDVLHTLVEPVRPRVRNDVALEPVRGYSHEGGSIRRELESFAQIYPLQAIVEGTGIVLAEANLPVGMIVELEEPIAWSGGEFGQIDGMQAERAKDGAEMRSIRYYDIERDYQPGVQRGEGAALSSGARQVEFPGTMFASDARVLATALVAKKDRTGDTLMWRGVALDRRIVPGRLVRAPGHSGLWSVTSWEWREGGVELALARYSGGLPGQSEGASAGEPWRPADGTLAASSLRVFELPPEGLAQVNARRLFAAIGAGPGVWRGSSVYQASGTELRPIAASGPVPAINGVLANPLAPSLARTFEPDASTTIRFERPSIELPSVSLNRIANGANRLLVGGEIVQFATAEPAGEGNWRLTGLLRGRGGTEHHAMAGHATGTLVTVLDTSLIPLAESGENMAPGTEFLAIGVGNEDPATAKVEHSGMSQRPLPPVHCQAKWLSDDRVRLGWTRRARGAWTWQDETDTPLIEQSERYVVGIGDPAAPAALWEVAHTSLELTRSQLPPGADGGDGRPVWVRQVGTFGTSQPSLITHI